MRYEHDIKYKCMKMKLKRYKLKCMNENEPGTHGGVQQAMKWGCRNETEAELGQRNQGATGLASWS
jgi:hypothetical protein